MTTLAVGTSDGTPPRAHAAEHELLAPRGGSSTEQDRTTLGTEVVSILLVDDRVEDLSALSRVLERPGYRLVTAGSAAEALRQLLREDFAVILMDLIMPVVDGFELAELIKRRKRSCDTPIIFLTGADPDIARIYRGYSVGAVDYLQKPVAPDVLRAKVGIFAELFRKDRRLQRQAVALQEAERLERQLQIAELQLNAERRYFNLAEAIPHIVWTAGTDGALTYATRWWSEYTGLEIAQAKGMGWTSVIHEDDAATNAQAWRDAVATGVVYEAECRIRRASDGSYRWHLCRAVPERNDVGEIVAWLGTYTDIEDMKQAIGARDEFLSIASHELRTPLTALKLRVQSLLRSEDLNGKARSKVESAARQTDRLERLIDNLLDVSRITTGHLELEREDVDLVEVADEVVERCREEANGGVSIDLDREGSVPGRWDRLRLEQVVTNLMSNAIKYGEGKPVFVTVRSEGTDAFFSVRDGGVGIAKEHQDRIFQQFERAPQQRSIGGLGMGLFIARQIADAHGGSIALTSEVGVGSTFTVRLPRDE